MARPTMATMKALEAEKAALEAALAAARAKIDARDEKIEDLEDARDLAATKVQRLQAALDALAEDEMRARMRFDAAVYAMVLMQRETRALRDSPRPVQGANKGEWRWDGKDAWEASKANEVR